MKKQFALIALLVAVALSHAVQAQIRLSISDQQRFDSYYSRWQSYKATNNQSEVRSMEGRMQDVYRHYGIPANTPYGRVASGGGRVWQGGNWPAGTAQGGDRDWRADRDRYYRHREWEREHERYGDRDWDRDHYRRERWHRDGDRDDDQGQDRDEARHDHGLHRGWYKGRGNPHRDQDGDSDRDHDRDDRKDHEHKR